MAGFFILTAMVVALVICWEDGRFKINNLSS